MATAPWTCTFAPPCSQQDPLRDPFELVEGSQTYSIIRLRDGQERTVSTSDLAPFLRCPVTSDEMASDIASNHPPHNNVENFSPACHDTSSTADETFARSPDLHPPSPSTDSFPPPPHEDVLPSVGLRGQEYPLISLVTGPHNFERGESVAGLLLVAAFINCCLIGSLIARLIELHCLVCSFRVKRVR